MWHDGAATRNLTGAGVTEQVAMKITGHKTNSMFRRYNIVTTNDMREALKLGRAHAVERGGENVVRLKAPKP